MDKITIIGNWKMNLKISSSKNLIDQIKANLDDKDYRNVKIIVCPSFIHLNLVKNNLNSKISLGCQNLFWENDGAFTGEISAAMAKDMGCQYAIIGHSERKNYLGETDDLINKKLISCFKNNIIPILCVGENINQHKNNQTISVLNKQIKLAFENVSFSSNKFFYIAYEPVWAIGSNNPSSPQHAKNATLYIKNYLLKKYKILNSNSFKVLYGGSVNALNIRGFTRINEIDGVLVGGKSIDSSGFVKLIKNSYK